MASDTKGDVYRNYGTVARECYGYRVGVIDLNWLAGISAICGATGVLLLYFWVKLIRRRAKAAAEQAAQGVEAPEPLQLAAEDPAPEEPEAAQPSEDAPDGEDPPRP